MSEPRADALDVISDFFDTLCTKDALCPVPHEALDRLREETTKLRAPRCEHCGKPMTLARPDGVYLCANPECHAGAIACPDCGHRLRYVGGEDYACSHCKDPHTLSGERYWRVITHGLSIVPEPRNTPSNATAHGGEGQTR